MTPPFPQENFQPTFQPNAQHAFGIGAPTAASGAVRNSVAQPRPTGVHDNPHSIRWFYGAGVLFPQVKARTTGMQTGFVPQGTLVAFEDFSIPIDNSNLDSDERVIYEEITALEAVNNAISELSGRGGLLIDVLTGNTDQAMLARLFEIVHPSFADLEHVCPENLTICPTCRIAYLDEEFINDRIDLMAQSLGVDPTLAAAVANALRAANAQLLTNYRADWNLIRQELEQAKTGKQGALRILFPEHHYIRQCLHESSPENAQAQVAAGYGIQVATAMQETARVNTETMAAAIKEVSGAGNDRLATALEAISQQNAMMMQLLINRQTADANQAAALVTDEGASVQEPPVHTNGSPATKPSNNSSKTNNK